jgi:hypothetical protein
MDNYLAVKTDPLSNKQSDKQSDKLIEHQLTEMFNTSNLVSNTVEMVNTSVKILTDKRIIEHMLVGKSKTYNEDVLVVLKGITQSLLSVNQKMKSLKANVCSYSLYFGVLGMKCKTVFIQNKSQTVLSTMLYIEILNWIFLSFPNEEVKTKAFDEIKNMRNCIIDESFSIPSNLHPVQLLSATMYPLIKTSPDSSSSALTKSSAKGERIINLTLPQSNVSYNYVLSALIDFKYISKYGPIASTTSGLSLQLFDRLQTIKMMPIKKYKEFDSYSSDNHSSDNHSPSNRSSSGDQAFTTDNGIVIKKSSMYGLTKQRVYSFGIECGKRILAVEGIRSTVVQEYAELTKSPNTYTSNIVSEILSHIKSIIKSGQSKQEIAETIIIPFSPSHYITKAVYKAIGRIPLLVSSTNTAAIVKEYQLLHIGKCIELSKSIYSIVTKGIDKMENDNPDLIYLFDYISHLFDDIDDAVQTACDIPISVFAMTRT